MQHSISTTTTTTRFITRSRSRILTGGTYVHCSLSTPYSGDELRKMIETFDKGKGPIKKSFNAKLYAVSTQNVPKDKSAIRKFLAET